MIFSLATALIYLYSLRIAVIFCRLIRAVSFNRLCVTLTQFIMGNHKVIKLFHISERRFCTFFKIFSDMNSSSTLYKLGSGNANINFQQILTIWQQNPTLNHAKCMSILWDIISKIQRNQKLAKELSSVIEPAIEYIQQHYLDQNISIEQISTRCGVSYSQFLKIIEKQTSTTKKNIL